MKNSVYLVVFYSLFSFLATVVNIGSQILFVSMYPFLYAIEASILVGTILGLIIKYILDKKYIFRFKANNIGHDGKRFSLYALMGVLTTIIFWGVEYLFHILFRADFMRYVGGVIGLIIGYTIKYYLDRKFVFINESVRFTVGLR